MFRDFLVIFRGVYERKRKGGSRFAKFKKFNSRSRRHVWVEFVVGSLLALRGFLRVLRFSPLLKNQHSKFQLDLESVPN